MRTRSAITSPLLAMCLVASADATTTTANAATVQNPPPHATSKQTAQPAQPVQSAVQKANSSKAYPSVEE